MALLGFLFFAAVFSASVWSIYATVAPRAGYLMALLSGSAVAPVLLPVAQRRRVRRLKPLSLQSELRLLRAAA